MVKRRMMEDNKEVTHLPQLFSQLSNVYKHYSQVHKSQATDHKYTTPAEGGWTAVMFSMPA